MDYIYLLLDIWPLWIPIVICLLILCGVPRFLLNRIGRWQDERRDKKKQLVAENSEWYKKVLNLNSQTKYYKEVFHDGRSQYDLEVNSKAKFDHTTPIDGLYLFLAEYQMEIEQALEQIRRNRIIYEVYNKQYMRLQSTATADQCKKIGLNYNKFLELEIEVVQEAKLDIVRSYTVACVVSYVSPKGRNRYRKNCVYGEKHIYSALKELNKQLTYQRSEEYRRKNERTKVTPSLRYRIMQRDGFKCCLCGRTAANGIELEVDHIIPISKGGSSEEKNLQTLCRDCNRGKGSNVLTK